MPAPIHFLFGKFLRHGVLCSNFSKMIVWVRVSYMCRGVLNGFAGGSLRFPAAFAPLLRHSMICCVVITIETMPFVFVNIMAYFSSFANILLGVASG